MDIFNLGTGAILKSQNTNKFLKKDRVTVIAGFAIIRGYAPDEDTVDGTPARYRKMAGVQAGIMTTQEKTDVDNTAPRLATDKTSQLQAIDSKSAALRAEGYEHPAGSGNKHSLSLEAQGKLANIIERGTFPWTVSTLDETSYVIPTAADAAAMRTKQLAREGAIHQEGSVLKNSVTAATTQAERIAVDDDRT